MHNSTSLIYGAIIFGAGMYLGTLIQARQMAGIYELDVVWDAALSVPLHTSVLTDLREGSVDKAISTMEGSLTFEEGLLNTCFISNCLSGTKQEVIRANELIEKYRKKYSQNE